MVMLLPLKRERKLQREFLFRGSIEWLLESLSTLRSAGYPHTTQYSLPAAGQALPGEGQLTEFQRKVSVHDVTTPPPFPDFPGATFLQVPDTLSALHLLTAFHRQQFNFPVIGITGSNGKTIVKEWPHLTTIWESPTAAKAH